MSLTVFCFHSVSSDLFIHFPSIEYVCILILHQGEQSQRKRKRDGSADIGINRSACLFVSSFYCRRESFNFAMYYVKVFSVPSHMFTSIAIKQRRR